MDFEDSAEDASYRLRVRSWLAENAREFEHLDFNRMSEQQELPYSRQWQARKAAAGYAAIPLPESLGGGGGTTMQSIIFAQEEAKLSLPYYGYFAIGLGMALPTMMSFASERYKKELMPKLLSGEHIWCQLFSEPSAGSDLANVRTKAEKEGGSWRVNGQKVWTTQGHLADYGILLARTDPAKPKHAGLTFFFVDLRSEGVDVRRIKQINGESEFNEVYFNDVVIPDSQRLGEVGEGFKVALTTLMFERQAGSEHSLGLLEVDDIFNFLDALSLDGRPALDNESVAERLVDWHIQMDGLRYILYQRLTQLAAGKIPGPEAALGKLVEARLTQDMSRYCMDLIGPAGNVMPEAAFAELMPLVKSAMYAPGIRIAGGTDEILKNTIAERVLGLPPEIRQDKDLPFNELQH